MRPFVGLQVRTLGVNLIAGREIAFVHSSAFQIEIRFAVDDDPTAAADRH